MRWLLERMGWAAGAEREANRRRSNEPAVCGVLQSAAQRQQERPGHAATPCTNRSATHLCRIKRPRRGNSGTRNKQTEKEKLRKTVVQSVISNKQSKASHQPEVLIYTLNYNDRL